MAMIGKTLVKRPVRSAATGEVIAPMDSQQPIDPPAGMSSPPMQMSNPLQMALASALPSAPDLTLPEHTINMPPPAVHHKFFTSDGTGTGNRIVGIIGDALAGAAGQPGMYAKTMEQRRQDEQQHQWKLDDARAEYDAKANEPQYFSGREDRLSFDPRTGQTTTLYSAPNDAVTYAKTLGFAEGTPEYNSAVQDYTLKSNGPTATSARDALLANRYNYMGQLQAPRLATSRRNTDVRTNATIANNMRSTRMAQRGQDLSHQDRQSGQLLTDSRIRGSAGYLGRGGRGSPAPAEAVSPDGHRIVVKNGRWVDAQTGAPVQ